MAKAPAGPITRAIMAPFAIPEDNSGNGYGRLRVGQKYALPDGMGGEVIGELLEATVMEKRKAAFCIYKLADGKQVLGEDPLSEKELAAYKRHPETFFG